MALPRVCHGISFKHNSWFASQQCSALHVLVWPFSSSIIKMQTYRPVVARIYIIRANTCHMQCESPQTNRSFSLGLFHALCKLHFAIAIHKTLDEFQKFHVLISPLLISRCSYLAVLRRICAAWLELATWNYGLAWNRLIRDENKRKIDEILQID